MPRTPPALAVLVALLLAAPAFPREDEKFEEREGMVAGVDVTGDKLTLAVGEERSDVAVGAKAAVVVCRRAGKLADVKEGMTAKVTLHEGTKDVVKVEAGWPRVELDVAGVDVKRYTLSVKAKGKNDVEFDATFTVAPDAVIEIAGIPAGLGDVPANTAVQVEFTADKKGLARVESDGEAGELVATVKAVNVGTSTLTLTVLAVGLRGEREVELSYAVTKDCTYRLAGKDVTLDDLKADMPVRCRFALDRRTVSGIWAGPPLPKAEGK